MQMCLRKKTINNDRMSEGEMTADIRRRPVWALSMKEGKGEQTPRKFEILFCFLGKQLNTLGSLLLLHLVHYGVGSRESLAHAHFGAALALCPSATLQ
ncbi:hypothetical protein E2C01_017006 [Portunus trituberculatus]|uniref:Uncharacterized protein n=1 Tax=Portunus trituberculatus TaxID=210409 RepID=A0A5B7DR92_PORTR|nr:hypothetical protein [Portunus trituberculatus]